MRRFLICFCTTGLVACGDSGSSATSFGEAGSQSAQTTDDPSETTGSGSSSMSTTDEPTTTSLDGSTSSGSSSTGPGCEELTEWFLDVDGDGYGNPDVVVEACEIPEGHSDNALDCNDDNEAINPDAPEICDDVDNDCNTLTDEFSDNNAVCQDCALFENDGNAYWFCDNLQNWHGARAQCLEYGGDLASVLHLSEHSFVVEKINQHVTAGDWFFGLNDLITEGTFDWSDGNPVSYVNWAPTEPNNLDDENCGELDEIEGYRWNDEDCENIQAYVCKAVYPVPR